MTPAQAAGVPRKPGGVLTITSTGSAMTAAGPRTLVSADTFDKIAHYFATKAEVTQDYAERATGQFLVFLKAVTETVDLLADQLTPLTGATTTPSPATASWGAAVVTEVLITGSRRTPAFAERPVERAPQAAVEPEMNQPLAVEIRLLHRCLPGHLMISRREQHNLVLGDQGGVVPLDHRLGSSRTSTPSASIEPKIWSATTDLPRLMVTCGCRR